MNKTSILLFNSALSVVYILIVIMNSITICPTLYKWDFYFFHFILGVPVSLQSHEIHGTSHCLVAILGVGLAGAHFAPRGADLLMPHPFRCWPYLLGWSEIQLAAPPFDSVAVCLPSFSAIQLLHQSTLLLELCREEGIHENLVQELAIATVYLLRYSHHSAKVAGSE